ncbi:BMC domain-containing protein [Clostridium sp. BJN0013]|uniref:BMC domain-containing protein n=1 Tax=Clostridium sp. BJN0013 TaxID=3236840 RepID=UPI0034C66F62
MNGEAIGVIETIGMTAAVEAADSCVKSANVTLIGYELTTGGLVAIKIEGDVGAVKAAIDAGKVSAERIGTVVGTLVIPRPAQNLHKIIESNSTVGIKNTEPEENLICDKEAQETLVSEKNLESEKDLIPEEAEEPKENSAPEETEKLEEDSVSEETEKSEEGSAPEKAEESKENSAPEETEKSEEGSAPEEAEESKEDSTPKETKEPEDLALEKDIELEKDLTPEKDVESDKEKVENTEESLTLKESMEPNNNNSNEEAKEKDAEVTTKKDKAKAENHVSSKKNAKDNEVCNICRDPACPRRKGQPRHLCLHYKKMGK